MGIIDRIKGRFKRIVVEEPGPEWLDLNIAYLQAVRDGEMKEEERNKLYAKIDLFRAAIAGLPLEEGEGGEDGDQEEGNL